MSRSRFWRLAMLARQETLLAPFEPDVSLSLIEGAKARARASKSSFEECLAQDAAELSAAQEAPATKPKIPEETKRAWQALKALPKQEIAFVLAWFCHCGKYLGPGVSCDCEESGIK